MCCKLSEKIGELTWNQPPSQHTDVSMKLKNNRESCQVKAGAGVFKRSRQRPSQAFPMLQSSQLMVNIATLIPAKAITLYVVIHFLSNGFGFRISSKMPH